jgi:hypothetical protein
MKKLLLLASFATILFTSCKKDDSLTPTQNCGAITSKVIKPTTKTIRVWVNHPSGGREGLKTVMTTGYFFTVNSREQKTDSTTYFNKLVGDVICF